MLDEEFIKEFIPHNFKNKIKNKYIYIFSKNRLKLNKLVDNIIKNNKTIGLIKNDDCVKEIILKNGMIYRIVMNFETCRGYKYTKVYIDKDINIGDLRLISYCSCCKSKDDIIVF